MAAVEHDLVGAQLVADAGQRRAFVVQQLPGQHHGGLDPVRRGARRVALDRRHRDRRQDQGQRDQAERGDADRLGGHRDARQREAGAGAYGRQGNAAARQRDRPSIWIRLNSARHAGGLQPSRIS